MIGLYLKKADQHLKAHNFDAAEREVSFALSEDPTNIYALAYKERIHRARLEYAEEIRQAEERRQKDVIYKQKELEFQKQRLEAARFPEIKKQPIPPSSTPTSTPAPPPNPIAEEKPKQAFTGGKLEKPGMGSTADKYKELLRGAWKYGKRSDADTALLVEARAELEITEEDHLRLEKEIKLESYVASIKNAWRQKKIIPTQPAAFDEFRKRFDISPEEHMEVEARLLGELQGQQKKEMIMYIDDDIGLTEVIDETLKDAGYKTLIATSPEQALQQMKNVIPDMIICDVRFPNSNMNGLGIYDEVRKMPDFNTVPFIFLSGVSDSQIMIAGLSSGADDYVTKPFNPDRLLALIEGKLKRYKELRSYQK
ncbi:MAG: PleD family two-component system response regulator [Bacteroidota bacterium]